MKEKRNIIKLCCFNIRNIAYWSLHVIILKKNYQGTILAKLKLGIECDLGLELELHLQDHFEVYFDFLNGNPPFFVPESKRAGNFMFESALRSGINWTKTSQKYVWHQKWGFSNETSKLTSKCLSRSGLKSIPRSPLNSLLKII